MDQNLLMLLLSPTQPRRIKTIENILLKRKTPSTLLFGMFYGILGFYGLGNRINVDSIDRTLHKLIQNNLAYAVGGTKPQYLLTTAGADWVHKLIVQIGMPINVDHNVDYDLLRFRRQFTFAIQAVSEFSYQNANYSPMFNDMDTQNQFKEWFYRYKNPQLASQFKQLLTAFLNPLPKTAANSFAKGMNGHQTTGLTIGQRASDLDLSPAIMEMFELSLFNQLISFVLVHRDRYPAIYGLVDASKRSLISSSALSTYHDYMNQAPHSLERLAKQHGFKLSTVRDHLYEAVILLPPERVKLTQFVSRDTINKIITIYHGDANEWQYDNDLAERYQFSFFDYRMVQIFRGKSDGNS